jgi:hypothetical protein
MNRPNLRSRVSPFGTKSTQSHEIIRTKKGRMREITSNDKGESKSTKKRKQPRGVLGELDRGSERSFQGREIEENDSKR